MATTRASLGIYTHGDRLIYLAASGASAATLALARLLVPSPRGVGTHEQLGLPPCLFFQLSGVPCPSCGLTTSFAHAARMDFAAALSAQPFGLFAFFCVAAVIPLAICFAARRIAWSHVASSRAFEIGLRVLLGGYLLGWIYKIIAMR
jgi:hypothetical protein